MELNDPLRGTTSADPLPGTLNSPTRIASRPSALGPAVAPTDDEWAAMQARQIELNNVNDLKQKLLAKQ